MTSHYRYVFHISEACFLLQKVKLNENEVNVLYFPKLISAGTVSRCSNRLWQAPRYT